MRSILTVLVRWLKQMGIDDELRQPPMQPAPVSAATVVDADVDDQRGTVRAEDNTTIVADTEGVVPHESVVVTKNLIPETIAQTVDAPLVKPDGFVRVISFLGISKMNETSYALDSHPDVKVKTRFAGYAVHRLFNADETMVFCTSAAQGNYNLLINAHPDAQDFRKIDIPDGMNTTQMWQIFQLLTDQVIDGDYLIVDVSNSFRSLPIIVSAALNFLQEVRNVTIYQVVYGAYDLHASIDTTIVNLQPFVDINKWVNATHSFIHYAQGEELARLLQQLSTSPRDPWREIGQKMRELTTALQLVSLPDIGVYAYQLKGLVDQAPQQFSGQYAPINALLKQVASEYASFATVSDVPGELRRQQHIMQWYLNHNLYAQAILLAREWMVSFSLYRQYRGESDVDLWSRLGAQEERDCVDVNIIFGSTGNDIRRIRNNLAHAVIANRTRRSSTSVHKEIATLCAQLIAVKV
jgi:hypothetical protein